MALVFIVPTAGLIQRGSLDGCGLHAGLSVQEVTPLSLHPLCRQHTEILISMGVLQIIYRLKEIILTLDLCYSNTVPTIPHNWGQLMVCFDMSLD